MRTKLNNSLVVEAYNLQTHSFNHHNKISLSPAVNYRIRLKLFGLYDRGNYRLQKNLKKQLKNKFINRLLQCTRKKKFIFLCDFATALPWQGQR